MTKRSSTPADAVLVAIDMSKHRQEVLIERPEGGRRRRMTVMATKADYDRLATDLSDIGRPIVETVLDDVAYDVLAVELSSFQLHWTNSLSLHSAAVLNVAPDHLEWHADRAGWPAGATALSPTTATPKFCYTAGGSGAKGCPRA